MNRLPLLLCRAFLACSASTLLPNLATPALAQQPRTIRAEVVALDQMLVYNRFGSFNPFGMVFALKRDVVSTEGAEAVASAEACGRLLGTEIPENGLPKLLGKGVDPHALAGKVRLKDCKRPRPLTLRANVGDVLEVEFTNLLRPLQPDLSRDFCRSRPSSHPGGVVHDNAGEAACSEAGAEAHEAGEKPHGPAAAEAEANWPATRAASFVPTGLRLENAGNLPAAQRDKCLGLVSLGAGESVTCRWLIDQEGPHFISSLVPGSGGEGDGGSLTHGLFGALIAEPEHSVWYRSQVTKAAFDAAWPSAADAAIPHRRNGALDYALKDATGVPILEFLQPLSDANRVELVHGDLNAIVRPRGERPFREFTVVFHDELKTFFTNGFQELADFEQLHGVRDGFGINYGASGMGSLLIANRKKIGPAANCVECLYEEFFLQSWANGDPALLEWFPDDPSNVHHSYLNDRVVFRNFHAGPKETHVFHLHAHQWFGGNDNDRGSYLDSQTVGPMQAFTYKIYHGGTRPYDAASNGDATTGPARGWWEGLGSGNRGRTPGDSIFHCHLYPHFAQGMWELWRVHDVLEDGSRKLPDGQLATGLSLKPADPPPAGAKRVRSGTAEVRNAAASAGTLAPETGFGDGDGTPVPGLIPLPDEAAPLLPTYGENGMPGYPFFMEAEPGHRSPQAPMDIARRTEADGSLGTPLDGGLPRHIVLDGARSFSAAPQSGPPVDARTLLARSLALADFGASYDSLSLKLIDYDGSPKERAGMGFHHDGRRDGQPLDLKRADGAPAAAGEVGYRSLVPNAPSTEARFYVNGSAPKPGAPFSDPCGIAQSLSGTDARLFARDGTPSVVRLALAKDWFMGAGSAQSYDFIPDPGMSGYRRYEASAVQLRLVVNRAGWHDPQGRINVLSSEADAYKGKTRADAEPFFFRALSGECIEFRHRNELPKELERDDFQVRTPTDTIGQHIHLVKFDVMASDGSGNGWNYEDGTYAPDEVAERVCKGTAAPGSAPGLALQLHGRDCARHDHYKESAQTRPEWFQTTVQRWFADPILSPAQERSAGFDGKLFDRTMRTVFTHDHFGPSSIQQHGFYSALVIEPAGKRICPDRGAGTALDPAACGGAEIDAATVADNDNTRRFHVGTGDGRLTGARKLVVGLTNAPEEKLHPDYREFMLAIADFALLYDPKGGAALDDRRGLACLTAEARKAADGSLTAANAHDICRGPGENEPGAAQAEFEDTKIPALVAGLDSGDAQRLTAAATAWRREWGKPVAAPRRPEAISTDHHDPYLVNYRNEPLPLRVGTHRADGAAPWYATVACRADALASAATVEPSGPDRSIARQRSGQAGDFANVFRSTVATTPADALMVKLKALHGDPCTPLIESFPGETVQIRLIQGAQEVQHLFTLEGFPFKRNPDQRFAMAGPPIGLSTPVRQNPTISQLCHEAARGGRPLQYEAWRRGELQMAGLPQADKDHWTRYTALTGLCDNIDGFVTAQEIGISEHFEFATPAWRRGGLAARMAPAPVPPGAEERSLRSDALPGDYLYHFGTQDALWNGAWGLMRVHAGKMLPPEAGGTASGGEIDFTACLSSPADFAGCRTANSGLMTLDDARAAVNGSATPRAQRGEGIVPSLVVDSVCPADAPRVRAFAAAAQLRDVGVDAEGMARIAGEWRAVYGHGRGGSGASRALYDPNALVLTLIDPARLPAPAANGSYPRAPVLAAMRQVLRTGLRPFTLRINAGDCLELTTLNGLREATRGGLPDAKGDASMPPIVPLNVEQGEDSRDVRPSASLALSIPLTQASHMRLGPAPVGINPTGAIAPSSGGRIHAATVSYYAGRIWPKEEALAQAMASLSLDGLPELRGVRLTPNRGEAEGTAAEGQGPIAVSVLSSDYYLKLPPAMAGDRALTAQRRLKVEIGRRDSRLSRALAETLRGATRNALNPLPYAFGPLPVKVLSDVIGQPTHGLIGMIVVEPKGAVYAGRPRGAAQPITLKSMPWQDTIDLKDTIGLVAAHLPARPLRSSFREGTLLFQDGLNLWASLRGNPAGAAPLRDCHVCDDSYDLGEKGVSYRSAPIFARIGLSWSESNTPGKGPGAQADISAQILPNNVFSAAYAPVGTPTLLASPGEEVVYRVLHPGGRARQRAFNTFGNGYDDLFPGFGFPNSALLAPGKALTAALLQPVEAGCYPWRDGPGMMFGGGVWGHLDVGRACLAGK